MGNDLSVSLRLPAPLGGEPRLPREIVAPLPPLSGEVDRAQRETERSFSRSRQPTINTLLNQKRDVCGGLFRSGFASFVTTQTVL